MKKISILSLFFLAFFSIAISACSQIKDNDLAKTARTKAAQDRIDGSNAKANSITKELD